VVDWQNAADQLTLQCEVAAEQANDALQQAIAVSIRDFCKLRGEVAFVTPGSLPNDGMVISDIRQYE
jgi:phenylacetate-CoA ligase